VIPDKSNRKWRELVTGKTSLQTENLGLQMFLKRAASKLAQETSTDEIDKSITELHSFFVKYERVLQKEIAAISR